MTTWPWHWKNSNDVAIEWNSEFLKRIHPLLHVLQSCSRQCRDTNATARAVPHHQAGADQNKQAWISGQDIGESAAQVRTITNILIDRSENPHLPSPGKKGLHIGDTVTNLLGGQDIANGPALAHETLYSDQEFLYRRKVEPLDKNKDQTYLLRRRRSRILPILAGWQLRQTPFKPLVKPSS